MSMSDLGSVAAHESMWSKMHWGPDHDVVPDGMAGTSRQLPLEVLRAPPAGRPTRQVSLDDWAQRRGSGCPGPRGGAGCGNLGDLLDPLQVELSPPGSPQRQRGHGGHLPPPRTLAPPPESDASLRDLLAPLVAEKVRSGGGLAPPDALELDNALAAISAVSVASREAAGAAGSSTSHFACACQSLAMRGFRRCSVVVDKLGVSVRCLPEDAGPGDAAAGAVEQVDFPWSSVSDVQDPRLKPGLQGCAVTLGVREPARLFEGPAGALALVLRLPDRQAACRLADTALAFKAYEAQAALWNACRRALPGIAQESMLFLDDRGCAFWSLPDDVRDELHGPGIAPPSELLGPVLEGSTTESQCCNLCWC